MTIRKSKWVEVNASKNFRVILSAETLYVGKHKFDIPYVPKKIKPSVERHFLKETGVVKATIIEKIKSLFK